MLYIMYSFANYLIVFEKHELYTRILKLYLIKLYNFYLNRQIINTIISFAIGP